MVLIPTVLKFLLSPEFSYQPGPYLLSEILLPWQVAYLPQSVRLSKVSVANLAPSILETYILEE